MRYKNIVRVLIASFICGIILRFVQVYAVQDALSGFYLDGYETLDKIMTVLIVAAVAAAGICGALVKRIPQKPPAVNGRLAASASALAVAMIFQLHGESFSLRLANWQILLTVVSGIFTIVFLFLFAGKVFFRYSIPSWLYIMPAAYIFLRLMCVFNAILALAVTSDNLFLLASYCSALVFWLEFGKLSCGILQKNSYRKLFSSGVCCTLISCIFSIPKLVFYITGRIPFTHNNGTAAISIFMTALFTFSFTFICYSAKRKRRKPSHRQ